MNLTGKVFITGGAGTLGKAILRRAHEENWDAQFTVYSTDPMKHKSIKEMYPKVTCVMGSVTDVDGLMLAIAGHDIVIHAAAMKHIVECERYPLATIDVNVFGSQNVFHVCAELGTPHVVAISTDKATMPINTYGVSKMMMERILHAYAEKYTRTDFHLCRYGNVVGSTGSFIHNWRRDLAELGYVNSTVREMTRFWMSEEDAVDVVLRALDIPSGCTLIPRPMTASIGDLEDWLLPDGTKIEHLGTRIGEKMHESLLSGTESLRTTIADEGKYFVLLPPQMENLFEFESQYELRSDNDKLRMDPKTALYLFGKVE